MRLSPTALSTTLLLAALVAAGCSHTPVTSLVSLSRVDMQTTELSALRVAVRIPDGFGPPTDERRGVSMVGVLNATEDRPRFERRFRLRRVEAAEAAAELARFERGGTTMHAFALAPADVPAFEAFRAMRKGSAGETPRLGSLTINAAVCRDEAAAPDEVIVSTFLRTSETGRYVEVLRDVDLLDEIGAADIDGVVPPCDR